MKCVFDIRQYIELTYGPDARYPTTAVNPPPVHVFHTIIITEGKVTIRQSEGSRRLVPFSSPHPRT